LTVGAFGLNRSATIGTHNLSPTHKSLSRKLWTVQALQWTC